MAASTRERARRLSVAASLLALLGGCGDDGAGRARGTANRGSSLVGGTVVSTVDGHPIAIADVQALMHGSSLSAREALERLQAEQLLMAEAERRGISGSEVSAVAQRASVQALLDREAARNLPTDSELRAAYAKDPRFHVPEQRTTIHVLARTTSKSTPQQVEAALGVAKRALADLETLDTAALTARYKGTIDGVTVKTEALPPVSRDSALVKEYLEAAFSLPEAGVVPEPVQTRFGWHAIRVLEITAAHETPYEEAVSMLRDEVTTKKQADGVSALLLELRHANPVQLAPDLDDKLSSVDGAETFR